MKTQHSTPVRASNPNVLVAHVSTKESYVEAAANVVVKDRSAVHVDKPLQDPTTLKSHDGEVIAVECSAGLAFSPHVITIGVGEDIVAKLLSLSQQRPRALCTMSGTGTVSLVTLRQPTSTNASVTFKGQFQILCLSASYLVAEDGGPLNRTGGISVLLSSPDGHVIGGGVVVLIAGSPVQIVMSFIPDLHNMAWVSVVAVLMSFTYSFIGLGLGIATVIIFQALGDIAFAYPYSILLLEIQSPPPENQTMQSSTCAVDALDMQLLKMIHQETS
ncbi:hypothetical protein JHK87_048059 [Glycine soja]|nr:hypothetical protein JHK87_048059 [Glycine soja]